MTWSVGDEGQRLLDRLRLALEDRLHAPIREIAHPAREPELFGPPARRLPKPHALHASAHEDVNASPGRGFGAQSLETAATNARSRSRTVSVSNFLAEVAMRVSAAPIAIGGLVSPFLMRWKRTGLTRATT